MREFTIKPGSPPEHVRAMVCGLPSAGKTFMAATSPKPLFISDASEGGYKTMFQMDPALWWDPAVAPDIWAIESMKDVVPLLTRLEKMAVEGKFPYRTIVFDPLSTYVDRVLAEFMQADPKGNNLRFYGDSANHLRVLVLRFHALPAHVLWLCHVKADGTEINGPAIGGQMANKFPAFCDFKWMCHVTTGVGQAPTYEMHTAPFRTWTFLGGRWAMPDPMIPSFKCVSQILGMHEKPISPAVPGHPDGVMYDGWPQVR